MGVRCPWVPASAVSAWSEVVEGGGGAGSRMAGMAGVGVVARRVHDRRHLPESEPGAQSWRRPCWASAGVDLDSADVVGGGFGNDKVDRVADQEAGCVRGLPVGRRAGVRSEVATTLRGHRVRPRTEPLVAVSLPGWTATCACGRSAAAARSERRPLDAGDALTCCFGVEVRGFEPLASSVRDLHGIFFKELRGVEDRGRPVRNTRSAAVDGRICGHDPPRLSGGLPGRYGHRLLPVCCPGVADPTFRTT
jgi:hypothetical protein